VIAQTVLEAMAAEVELELAESVVAEFAVADLAAVVVAVVIVVAKSVELAVI